MSSEYQTSIHDQCDWAAVKLFELGFPNATRSMSGDVTWHDYATVAWRVPVRSDNPFNFVIYEENTLFLDDGSFEVKPGDIGLYPEYYQDKVGIIRSVLRKSYERVQMLYHMRDDAPLGLGRLSRQMAKEIQAEIDNQLIKAMMAAVGASK